MPGVIISQQDDIVFANQTPTQPPPAGTVAVYARDNELYAMYSTGQEVRLPARIRNENAIGTKDGVNDTFSLDGSRNYIPGSIRVFLNGLAYNIESITEIGTAYTSFTITGDNLPNSTDSLTITYTEGV